MSRKLASVQKIVDIQPIEGADKIERLTVLGWHIVASKAENHKIGDLIVYIETDSRVPAIPMFEFLKDRKYIVKTIKLRKQISQGLVIPLREIEKNFEIDTSKFKEGDDITDLLGIKKYDPQAEAEARIAEKEMSKSKNPVHKFLMKYKWYRKLYAKLNPKVKSGFPAWIKKTDEDRIQVLPELFQECVDKKIRFDATEKLDGQSSTYFIRKYKVLGIIPKYEFGVCSRNLRLKTPTNSSYWTIARQLDIENVLKKLLKKYKAQKIVIQGEICGEGIQKNKYNILGYKLFVFNLIINDRKYRTIDIERILKPYGLQTVPIENTNVELVESIDEMVKDAEGKSSIYNTEREGKVWRDIGNNISFKVINPKFLLKNDE